MRRELLICLLLSSITLALYWQALNFEFVYLDDTTYVTENSHVQEGLTAGSVTWAFTQRDISYWHPMTWLSLMLDYEFYGLSPSGFHLTSVLLHMANVVLLFLALNRMTGGLWRSACVAALFALHPLNVESVAWVVERKNVLSTCFWMLTILIYAYYTQRPILRRYLLVLSCFTLGLMAKPMLVTIPCVLLLLDYWPLARFHLPQLGRDSTAETHTLMLTGFQKSPMYRLVLEKIPFFALSVVSIALSFWSGQHPGFLLTTETRPISLRLGNALISYAAYIGKMIWPSNLAVFYPPPGTLAWPQVATSALIIVLVSIGVLWLARSRPYILVGWLWYLGTLVPAIGLVQAGLWPAMADRFVYVPLIGLFIIIAWGVPDLLTAYRYRILTMTLAVGIVLSTLAVLTWTQLRHWGNSITLFEHAVQVTSHNYLAHNNLGAALFEQRKLNEAMLHYTRALEIKPNYWSAHNNMALVLAEQGKFKEAFDHYQEALKIKPDDAGIHNNFGTFLAQQGKPDQAIAHFSRALEIRPDFAEVYGNLGNVFKQQGKIDKAIAHYYKALEIKPNQVEAHNNLGVLLAQRGRLKQAVNHYSEALRLNPDSAETHNNLAVALVELEEIEAAIPHYAKALHLQPDYAEAHNNLGNAFSEQGKTEEAVASFTKALEIKPNYPEAHNNLGVALARQGRLNEAIYHFNQALRLKPDYGQARANLELALQMMERADEAKTTRGNP